MGIRRATTPAGRPRARNQKLSPTVQRDGRTLDRKLLASLQAAVDPSTGRLHPETFLERALPALTDAGRATAAEINTLVYVAERFPLTPAVKTLLAATLEDLGAAVPAALSVGGAATMRLDHMEAPSSPGPTTPALPGRSALYQKRAAGDFIAALKTLDGIESQAALLKKLGRIPSVVRWRQAAGLDVQALLHTNVRGPAAAALEAQLHEAVAQRAMVEAFGPMGDLLYLKDAQALGSRTAAMKAEMQAIDAFRAGLAETADIDGLVALAKRYAHRPLTAQCKNELVKKLMDTPTKDNANFAAAHEAYQIMAAAHDAYGSDEVGREMALVALGKCNPDPGVCLKECLRTVRQRAGVEGGRAYLDKDTLANSDRLTAELLATTGKQYRNLAQRLQRSDDPHVLTPGVRETILVEAGLSPGAVVDNQTLAQHALAAAGKYYEAGFALNFDPYPGTVAMQMQIAAGDVEGARAMAKLVQVALDRQGAGESRDYWTLATQVEVATVTGDVENLIRAFPQMLQQCNVAWKLEVSLSGLENLVSLHRGTDQEVLVNEMLTAMRTRLGQLKDKAAAMARAPGPTDRARIEEKDAAALTRLAEDARVLAVSFTPSAEVARDPAFRARRARGRTFMAQTADLRAMAQAQADGVVIGGNVAYGGQIPDMSVTRHTVRVLRKMMGEWGIDRAPDFATFNRMVNAKLNDVLHLQTPDGRRPLEDLKSKEHKVLDRFDKGRFELADVGRDGGDSRTDLVALMSLGIGDCRPTAFAKQLMFDVWQHDRVKTLMSEALDKGRGGDSAGQDALVDEAQTLMRQQLRVITVGIEAPIQMNALYDMKTDPEGRPLVDETGTMHAIENHTFNVLVEFDEHGALRDEVLAADAFYQHVYPLDGQTLSLEDLTADAYFDVDKMGIAASGGEPLPFRMKPSPYSGALLKHDAVGSCDVFFAGLPVAPPTAASFLDVDDEIHAVAVGIGQFAADARPG